MAQRLYLSSKTSFTLVVKAGLVRALLLCCCICDELGHMSKRLRVLMSCLGEEVPYEVTIEAFVAILWQNLSRSHPAHAASSLLQHKLRCIAVLEECFKQIDVSQTGTISYDMFIDYLVNLSTVCVPVSPHSN